MKGNNSYNKGAKQQLSDNFNSEQFDCHCTYKFCTTTLIDSDLIEALEELLKLTGKFKVNSGFRCLTHNKDIGGAPHSQHLLGRAADCESLMGYSGPAMARYAESVDRFLRGGIGIYLTFAHCDVRQEAARWNALKC